MICLSLPSATFSRRFRLGCASSRAAALIALLATVGLSAAARGQPSSNPAQRRAEIRCISLELYVPRKNEIPDSMLDALNRFVGARKGVTFNINETAGDAVAQQRLEQICKYFHRKAETPILYGCGQLVVPSEDPRRLEQQLKSLTTFTVYVRKGCPHCAAAKVYLPKLLARYPGFELVLRDIATDAQANRDLGGLVAHYRKAAASVPVFHLCDQMLVGFETEQRSGPRLERVLQRWTVPCSEPSANESGMVQQRLVIRTVAWHGEPPGSSPAAEDPTAEEMDGPPPLLPLPGEEPADETTGEPSADAYGSNGEGTDELLDEDEVDLPLFGRIQASEIGLPLFTVAIGLVDGFNPCAMWVLLFLLSVLVSVGSRWKMVAVAGSFVVISGLVYFAFMAAWLNVFLLVGAMTWLRVTLGVMAVIVGAVHVKDFFAFKRGVSFSIPDSAKPGIYERVRRIVAAENVLGAVIGASVLAVLVNMIELLCTAGLPAIYTSVLSAHELPAWENYAYLALYILAYMADDTLMVATVVVTLGRRKMQETHGRWLKLVSGGVVLALGLTMLVAPQLLGMSQ